MSLKAYSSSAQSVKVQPILIFNSWVYFRANWSAIILADKLEFTQIWQQPANTNLQLVYNITNPTPLHFIPTSMQYLQIELNLHRTKR